MSSPEELKALHLGGHNAAERLASLEVKLERDRAEGFEPQKTGEVNNHIHTSYSFSPYSPAEAAYGAWRAGLEAAGIIDHESVAGCDEMLEAGKRIGVAITSGCELRADAAGTALEGRRINNPDSLGILYMVLHGIPHDRRNIVEGFLTPIRESRGRRNRKQVTVLNGILKDSGLPVMDYDKDVMPLSEHERGGSVTERHILYALSVKLVNHFGKGEALLDALSSSLGLTLPPTIIERLSDKENPHYLYDLLGIFKGSLVSRFFQQPEAQECPPVREATALADRVGAIACYPYLGDVSESPTGDKKAEKYEDEWLDELFAQLPPLGFRGVTYMPPRNSIVQLERVKKLCAKYNLMEISGVDINSSRQSFRCPEVTLPEFSHLNDRTWALIAHEHLSSRAKGMGLFDKDNPLSGKSLEERLSVYARMGQAMDASKPESILEEARKERL